MLFREPMYFPARKAISGRIAGNPIVQLAHASCVEDVGYEGYTHRGVEGWTIHRENGDRVLAIDRTTSADPYGFVLVMPEAENIPASKEQAHSNTRWYRPQPRSVEDVDLRGRCSQARDSWRGAFNFKAEVRSDTGAVEPGLRRPQLAALHAALAHLMVQDGEVGTIVMPTGTGKTETMLAILARACPERLLVIVPTSALRDQIAEKFQTLGVLKRFGIVEKRAELPVVGKIEHQFNSPSEARTFLRSCNVAVATMKVIGDCDPVVKEAVADTCTHLFIDEAHHAPARTWRDFRSRVQERNKPVLQFTATPFRRDGKHIGGRRIFTYPLRQAQADGYFAPITFISIWEYNRMLGDEAIARRALQALSEDLDDGFDHLLMARTNTVSRAEVVQEVYQQLAPEMNPTIIHSGLKTKQQANALEAILSRESKVIVCVDMLGEGFDLPQLKVAALHDVHKSLPITIQFVGRFTRSASGLGEATIIANAADADVELRLEDLYAKDSDWNVVLRRLSEGESTKQRRRSEFIDGFENAPQKISLQEIRPKMSTVAYKTYCDAWNPSAVRDAYESTKLLVAPTVQPAENVLLFITREQFPVAWGNTKSVNDLVHHLYLAHWDEDQELLFINSTNNNRLHSGLAKLLAGDDVVQIRGEHAYRSLAGVNRHVTRSLGLLHQHSRATQFTMHTGSDVRQGLTPATLENRRKTNLFGKGYEGGDSVTLGASHKGRIWSHQVANDISEWVQWCRHVGAKLLDDSISTEEIFEHVIIPEVITARPSLVPIFVDWPVYFYRRSDEAIEIQIGGARVPFYQAAIEIGAFEDSGPLLFKICVEEVETTFEIVFKEDHVEYCRISGPEVRIAASNKAMPLRDWFHEEPPVITFEDTSKLEYNELCRPKGERVPFDSESIITWDWSDVDLTKESQYKKRRDPRSLQFRPDSIQRYVIGRLLAGEFVEYDIIFDDDDTGEIADIVALKIAGDNLLVHFFHCKFSKSATGVRVGDFYEVCGQAQKATYWPSAVPRMFGRLKLREQNQVERYNETRFMKGDLQKLEELRRHSRFLYPKFKTFIVQPGLEAARVSSEVLDLLGATELYLRETFDVDMKLIASP